MALPKQSIRITDLTRLDTPEKIDAKQELLIPVACNQTEKDTFSLPLPSLMTWVLLNHAANKDLSNLSDIGQGILDAKQDYFDQNADNTDLNTFTKDGLWKVKSDGSVEIHSPASSVGYFVIATDTDDNGVIEQQCRNLYQDPGSIYRRSRINGVWTEWSMITQDMYSPTFTEAPTVTNPGTNANQLATLGQLEERFADIFKTEWHLTEGLFVSGTVAYEDESIKMTVGSRYITNDSITVNVGADISLTVASTGTHYIFADASGNLQAWDNFKKVVDLPETVAPNTLYYNIMTDQYTDGTTIYSLAPLGSVIDGAWSEKETIQFLNLENLQATLDALNVQEKVDKFIGTNEQNSVITSDTEYERTVSAGHYIENEDGSFDLEYGAGLVVQTHESGIDDETDVKDVVARIHAEDGADSTEIEIRPDKATLASPRQNGVAYEIATMKDIEDVESTSISFKGFVSTTEPDASKYTLIERNMWINASTMPTTFPVKADTIKVWDGSAWVQAESDYTPLPFDAWRNINNNEGYYWFGGQWVIMSTDMSTDYFTLNQTSGKWEIKTSVKLGGSPTTTTQDITDKSSKIATTEYVQNHVSNINTTMTTELAKKANLAGGNTFTGAQKFNDYITLKDPPTNDNSTTAVSSSWVNLAIAAATAGATATPSGTIAAYGGSTPPAGWLLCDGGAVSRTTYAKLFAAIGTAFGTGDGNGTFNLPNWSNWLYSVLPDFSRTTTLPSSLTNNGWVTASAVNVSTVVKVNSSFEIARGDWYRSAWSGNLNLQMLMPKGTTISGTAGTTHFIPLNNSKPYGCFIIKY